MISPTVVPLFCHCCVTVLSLLCENVKTSALFVTWKKVRFQLKEGTKHFPKTDATLSWIRRTRDVKWLSPSPIRWSVWYVNDMCDKLLNILIQSPLLHHLPGHCFLGEMNHPLLARAANRVIDILFCYCTCYCYCIIYRCYLTTIEHWNRLLFCISCSNPRGVTLLVLENVIMYFKAYSKTQNWSYCSKNLRFLPFLC